MDRETLVYPHNVITPSNNKGQTKPDSKGCILYSIYLAHWKRQTFREKTWISVANSWDNGIRVSSTTQGTRTFWHDENALYLDFDGSHTIVYVCQNS